MGNDMPLISVVMITYQHEKYIAEAIQSILGYLKLVVCQPKNDG